jgi:hypothetical protein
MVVHIGDLMYAGGVAAMAVAVFLDSGVSGALVVCSIGLLLRAFIWGMNVDDRKR